MNLVSRPTLTALAVLMVSAAFAGAAFAGTDSSPAPATKTKIAAKPGKMAAKPVKVASTFKCPSCGMMMPSAKSAKTPVPVVINGHTYYCCAGCASGKATAAKMMKKPA
jgi:hypothetical protein